MFPETNYTCTNKYEWHNHYWKWEKGKLITTFYNQEKTNADWLSTQSVAVKICMYKADLLKHQ